MKLRFVFVLFCVCSFCALQSQTNSVEISVSSLEKDLDFENQQTFSWTNFLNSQNVDSDVNILKWKWQELGPSKTPPEGKESKALRSQYQGRGNGTGRINNLFINKYRENQVFACSPTGGLFFSENKGRKWKSGGTENLLVAGVSSVCVNPINSRNWVISTGDGDDRFIFSDGVYRTFNKGKAWEKINGKGALALSIEENQFDFHVSEVVSNSCNFDILYLASNLGLFISTNSSSDSVNWNKVSGQKFYDIENSNDNPSLVVAGGENLFISHDCGYSWKEHKTPELPSEEKYGLVRLSVELNSQNQDIVLVAITRKKGLGEGGIGASYLYSFNLLTKEWKEISQLKKSGNLIPTRARAFAVNPKNDSLLILGNVGPAYVSNDLGYSFQRIKKNQMHDDIHDFEFFSDGRTLLSSHDGGVSVSYDSGETWTPWDDGISAANVHGLSVAQSKEIKVLYGAYDCGSSLFEDKKWSHVAFGDGFETVINKNNPNLMLTTMQNGSLYKSTADSVSFDTSVRKKGMKASWHTWLKSNPDSGNIVYLSGHKIHRSMDFGETWEVIFEPKDLGLISERAWKIYQSDGLPNQMIVVVLGKSRADDFIYFSSNVNDTLESVKWIQLSKTPRKGWVSTVLNSPECETCHYLAYSTYKSEKKLFYFDGSEYQDESKGFGNVKINSSVLDKNTGRIYFGTKSGLFTKLPKDSDWTLLEGLPAVRIRSMVINYERSEIYLGTFGRGIWKAKLMKE